MRNLFLVLILMLSLSGYSQTNLSQEKQKKAVVLEEYTGIHCGFCPDGHRIAREIQEAYPDRVHVIAVHCTSFAQPQAGQPDFRTDYGDTFFQFYGMQGVPSGTVNRADFKVQGKDTKVLSRNLWKTSTEAELEKDAPVNIGLDFEYDKATRKLTVKTELYYTASSAKEENKLNIALVQNDIIGYQSGVNNYRHMHVLRHLLTGLWGEAVSPTTEGTTIKKEHVYTLPEEIKGVPLKWEDCEIIAFVAEDKVNVLNSAARPLTKKAVVKNEGSKFELGKSNEDIEFEFKLKSEFDESKEFSVEVIGEGAPEDWKAELIFPESRADNKITLATNEAVTLKLKVVPSSAMGDVMYKVKLTSIANPEDKTIADSVRFASGFTTYFLNNVDFNMLATKALDKKLPKSYLTINSNDFSSLLTSKNIGEIKNLLFNVATGWGYISQNDVKKLMELMDGGCNLLMMGQDVGAAIFDKSGPIKTDDHKKFFNEYLGAKYIADSPAAIPQKAEAVAGSLIYDDVESFSLVNIYGSSYQFYFLDVMEPQENAKMTFCYDGKSELGAGVAYKTDKFRSSTLGFNLEFVKEEEARDKIMSLTVDYFDGKVSLEEYSNAMNNIMQITPNPVVNNAKIAGFNVDGLQKIYVYNISGQLVHSIDASVVNGEANISLEGMEVGMYEIATENGQHFKVVKK
ncbi:MAG: Omp28-related outer membrane protein [Bacteroidales bacterium]